MPSTNAMMRSGNSVGSPPMSSTALTWRARSRWMKALSAPRSVWSFVCLSNPKVKNQHPRQRRLQALVRCTSDARMPRENSRTA